MAEMISIRESTFEDVLAIARIHVESWRVAYKGQIPDAILSNLNVDKRASLWADILSAKKGIVLVAETGGKVIGFCEVIPTRDEDENSNITAEIASIYVDPKHWRKGAGSALCGRAQTYAREFNYKALMLWVLKTNTSAICFYQLMGFKADGATKKEAVTVHFGFDEIRLRKELVGQPERRNRKA